MQRYLIPIGIFVVFFGFLAAGLQLNPREVPSPLINKSAPTFTLPVLGKDNATFSPEDMRGKVWVLNVWASWCAPCRAEAPTLAALSKKYSDVAFIGILTRDNPASAEAFNRKLALPYPTLIDDSVLIGFRNTLPANAIPSTVVLDKNGDVAGRISGAITVASLTSLIEKVSNE